MPSSMTGYGLARRASPLGAIQIEIRSVNNRYLDLSFRGAGDWREWETTARALVGKRISRGKVEVTLTWERGGEAQMQYRINREALTALIHQVREVAAELEISPAQLLGPVANLPGMVERRAPEINAEALAAELTAALTEALDRFEQTRRTEGAALANDLLARSKALRGMCASLAGARDVILQKYRLRLQELTASLSQGAQASIHPDRLEAEIALLADRCDISEELTRLEAHLTSLEAQLREDAGGPVGKSLEFLVQELLREANTIASKARETEAIRVALDMKNEIEKIREQVQNIE
ncbi:MAG: YicC family protein [Candidatus Sumerlaeota bacterium]|nr:YicC family protein [Candidatus Sumerlaeota bacterium]